MFQQISRPIAVLAALAGFLAGSQPLLAAPAAPSAPDAEHLHPADMAPAASGAATVHRLHRLPQSSRGVEDPRRQALDQRVETLAKAAEAADPAQAAAMASGSAGVRRQGTFDFGAGPEAVNVVERDGLAFYQGDIVLGSIDRIARGAGAAAALRNGQTSADPAAADGTDSLILRAEQWPNGRIVYEIDEVAFPQGSPGRDMVEAAIHVWNTQTLIRLVPRDSGNWRQHHVWINDRQEGCFSMLGYQPNSGGYQPLNLAAGCDFSAAVHEIGHAVGLLHEQERGDRDSFINVNFWNIDPARQDQFYKHGQTDMPGMEAVEWGPYDLRSIMHYESLGFALDRRYPALNRRNCDPLDMSPGCLIGRNARLTTYDKAGITRIVTGDPEKVLLVGSAKGRCLAVIGGSLEDGVPIVDQDCQDQPAQRWYGYDDGAEGLLIVNEGSRLCITADDDNLLQRPCTGEPGQRFTLNGGGDETGEPPELPAIAPREVVGQRSVWGGQASKITFVNQRDDWTFIYWVDGNGGYHHYYSLPAGGSYLQESYGGHLWVAVDRNGYILAGYRATDDDARAVVR